MLKAYHYHPALRAGTQGPMVGRQRVLLRQGENDAACGYHCVLMALMLHGLVFRRSLDSDTTDSRLQAVRNMGQLHYFQGCSVQVMRAMVQPYADVLACKELRRNVVQRTVQALEAGQVCLVAFSTEHYGHWVLAVGVAYEAGEPRDLLVLDPYPAPLPLVPWNAMLTGWGSEVLRYACAGSAQAASIDAVLVLSLVLQQEEDV